MKNKELNSDKLTKGLLRAPHRSLLYALGLDKEDFKMPKIGIVNSKNMIVPGHMHLDQIVDAVKKGVHQGGGVALEFNTIATCDGLSMNHDGMHSSLPTREIIADSIEATATAFKFDALVFVPSCDKVIPGMLMAAARLNLPSIFISGGPMLAGKHLDSNIALTNVYEAIGKYNLGLIDDDELEQIEISACPTCGSCAGMYTANTMNCLTEAMGISLNYCGTMPAVYSQRLALATQTGRQIMRLFEQDIKFKDIVTNVALENAIRVDMALGGSTNTTLHLPAIAYECGYDLSLKDFKKWSKSIPQIVKLSPASSYHIEDLFDSGGIYAVMRKLFEADLLDDELTVNLESWKSFIYKIPFKENGIIKDINNPYYKNGGLSVLSGNLAVDGCVVKSGAVSKNMLKFKAPAVVFENENQCISALMRDKIKSECVIVVRNEGPKGGPGMKEMLMPTSILSGLGLDDKVALITDGRFSGGSRGAVIGHISPEACEGGVIGLVQNGDIIEIDIENDSINLLVSDVELESRRKNYKPFMNQANSKFLKKYQKLVSSAASGAIMKLD